MNIDEIVKLLMDNKILQFGDFRLASGRASPYYFNMRALLNFEDMSKIGDLFANKINQSIGLTSFDTLFGVAYTGILLCYLTAESLWRNFGTKKRFAYNRRELKQHGDPRNRLIAGGQLNEKDTILFVDDVLTTGKTKLKLKRQITKTFPSVKFRGLLVFLDRCETNEAGHDPRRVLEEKGLPVFSILSTIQILTDASIKVEKSTLKELQNYLQTYGREGSINV